MHKEVRSLLERQPNCFYLLAKKKKKVGFVDIYTVLVANSSSEHFVSVKFTVKSNGCKYAPFLVLLEAIPHKVESSINKR